MSFSDSDIDQVTSTAFELMLGLEIQRNHHPLQQVRTVQYVTGCVHISGAWGGSMTVACTEHLARKATAIMFASEEAAVSDEEIQDAVGELSNIIAGNIKGLYDGNCSVSLPVVVSGVDYDLRVPGTTLVGQYVYDCLDQSLVITILNHRD